MLTGGSTQATRLSIFIFWLGSAGSAVNRIGFRTIGRKWVNKEFSDLIVMLD